MENDIPRKQKPKVSKSSYSVSDKIDFKLKKKGKRRQRRVLYNDKEINSAKG